MQLGQHKVVNRVADSRFPLGGDGGRGGSLQGLERPPVIPRSLLGRVPKRVDRPAPPLGPLLDPAFEERLVSIAEFGLRRHLAIANPLPEQTSRRIPRDEDCTILAALRHQSGLAQVELPLRISSVVALQTMLGQERCDLVIEVDYRIVPAGRSCPHDPQQGQNAKAAHRRLPHWTPDCSKGAGLSDAGNSTRR